MGFFRDSFGCVSRANVRTALHRVATHDPFNKFSDHEFTVEQINREWANSVYSPLDANVHRDWLLLDL